MNKTIRDAVHGDMQFDAAELAVIDTVAVQRLRGIKQLGTSHLVYPSAVHTRFEHSLGAAWMTKRLIESTGRRGLALSPEQRQTACIAAILHDVTHVPFGHTFEDERRLFERHDQDDKRLDYFLNETDLGRVLDQLAARSRVAAVLRRSAHDDTLKQLVSGTICADLLDYLRRDALHCGLALGYDDRIFEYFGTAEGRLVFQLHKGGVFRRDALSELIHLLQIRYSLTERVYYHHAKVVAGAMISRALELALAAGALQREELYVLRDDSFLWMLAQRADQVPGLADLLDDLGARRLYRRVYALGLEGLGRPGIKSVERDSLVARFHSDATSREELERSIAERIRVPVGHVIVYCPSREMALKEADVPVELSPGRVQPLSSLGHPDVDALSQKHQGLWRFLVCLRREHADHMTAAGRVCEELIGHDNQLKPLSTGRFALPASLSRNSP